ncbi:SusE domain-containing protein [Olivibacter sitiensis]|uniref:SusE domain-containing protein n=1 Tax=Olivibacter sitiensis TaxID=376470 RepID=UPI000489C61D|nr:SusE domain-containing protein [Olivibacter sitiensis]
MKIKLGMLLCAIASLVYSSCNKDKELSHTEVSEVSNLYLPKDDAFVKLGTGSETFEWEMARAADNGLVMYEVVFDKADGDFSNPLYRLPSDGNGMQRNLTVTHARLNQIAEMAGIAAMETGTVLWSVVSSKGINAQRAVAIHKLHLERPMGFSTLPSELYITGDASEGGSDVGNALAFKQIANGEFEIYTKLGNGSYSFLDGRNENAQVYSINTDGIIVEGGSSEHSGEKIYRIKLNFNNASVQMTEINELALWFAPDDTFWFTIPYTGNGTWEVQNVDVVFKQESWGRDERYKFRFKVIDGGEEKEEWYGSRNTDNNRPTSTTQASYWFMVPVTNDRWNNSFKFDGDVDNKKAHVKVIFNREVEAYTHSVTVAN